MNYPEMNKWAETFKIPVAKCWQGDFKGLKDFQEHYKATSGIEGFVIRFDNGAMYKVKTDWYFERTKKEKQEFSFNSEKSVWGLILDQQVDDALAFMKDQHLKEKVKAFEDVLWEAIEKTTERLLKLMKEGKEKTGGDRKKYWEYIKANFSTEEAGILSRWFDKKEDDDFMSNLIEHIQKNKSTKAFEGVRQLLGGIKFVE